MGGAFAGDNLMEDDILLSCQTSTKQCDKLQVSAYDPEYNRIYFQGHSAEITSTDLILYALQFEYSRLTGAFEVIIYKSTLLSYGYTAFQFVPFVNAAKSK